MNFIKLLKEKYNINLNIQQQEAVQAIQGPVLLLAVPGAGKTTVIVSRCANMVMNNGIKPENILTLTFSKASALDMKNRFSSLFGTEAGEKMHFSTIHSFCYSVIRTYVRGRNMKMPSIIEDEKAEISKSKLLRQIYFNINNDYISDDKLDDLSNSICYVKNMMLKKDEISKLDTGIENFYDIYTEYERYKSARNMIDYDDMLIRTLQLFDGVPELLDAFRNKYRYVNIDEAQDTSCIQHEIIERLAKPLANIFMVGDEDQSIYGFRAAYPGALLQFEKKYPGSKILFMEQNYRSTVSITEAARNFIRRNKERRDKNMFTENEQGEDIKVSELKDREEQYNHISDVLSGRPKGESTAVLFRNNTSAVPLADFLERRGIEFYIRDYKNSFFNHWVTRDIMNFLKLSKDMNDIEAFKGVYYKMNSYISRNMLEYVSDETTFGKDIFEKLKNYPEITVYVLNRLREIKNCLESFERIKPSMVIDRIINTLGYGEYLKKSGRDSAGSGESYYGIINGLKSIAGCTSNLEEFNERCIMLQQIMGDAKHNKGKSGITLSTLHSSKGLEFDRVLIIDLIDGQFPASSVISEYNTGKFSLMEEEVRLFYVGVTRARKYVELMTFTRSYGEVIDPSRFIKQLIQRNGGTDMTSRSIIKRKTFDKDNKYDPILVLEDIYKGMKVVHANLGFGEVVDFDTKKDIIGIEFEGRGYRALSIKICIESGILKKMTNINNEL